MNLSFLPSWLLPYVPNLTPEQWRLSLFFLLSLFIVGNLLLFVYCLLRAFGWRRYQGTWYNREQFRAIVQELYSGVRAGRVPDYETMCLLDEYVYGSKGSTIRKLNKPDHI